MTIGTLVVIALAILVFVVLAFGFGLGWSTLWSKISPSVANVDALRTQCQTACITQLRYEYCCLERKIVKEQGATPIAGTCFSERSKLLQVDCSME